MMALVCANARGPTGGCPPISSITHEWRSSTSNRPIAPLLISSCQSAASVRLGGSGNTASTASSRRSSLLGTCQYSDMGAEFNDVAS